MSKISSAPITPERRKTSRAPYWQRKSLAEMTRGEWEQLCDGCGKCCLHKLEYMDTGEIEFTNVACELLDTESCRCKDYTNRKQHVPDCVKLTPARVKNLSWLPSTCAYRLIDEGKDLPDWHPLVTGDPQSVHQAGISVKGRVIAESEAQSLEHHVVDWKI